MRISSLSVASPRLAATTDALVALSREATAPASCARVAELLARALALVNRRHSLSAPTRARQPILAALDDLQGLVLQHLAAYSNSSGSVVDDDDSGDDGATLADAHQRLLDGALRGLWAHVLTYALYVALADLIAAVDFIPHALRYWKLQRRRPVRATLRSGPGEWLLPVTERITLDERIYSLESTLQAILEKLGNLKELAARLLHTTMADEDAANEDLLTDGLRLLQHAYSSSGIVPPRKGKGAFKKLEPMEFCCIYFESCVTADPGTSQVSVASTATSLRLLLTNVDRFKASREQFSRCFNTAMAPCRVPSQLRQRWLHITVTAACVAAGVVWITRNQREFREGLKTAKFLFEDFLSEHMIEPLEAIVGEVLLNQKPEIQDAAALMDTKESLRRMLSDFVRDTNPSVSSAEMQRILKDMDMSVVSLQYEKQLGSAVRNIMSGDIVRMLLIQVQFIKKELMVAMGAIDELMHANQLNLQMLATIPTFIMFGGAYTLAKELFHQVYKRTSERLYYDPGEIAGFLRNILRDIERLLNKQNRSAWNGQEDEVLGPRDLGLLMLLLHQLRDVFESYRELFGEEEQQRFEEDLNDLIEEGLLVSQQLAVIQRMYHSHPFLQRQKISSRWLLH